MKKFIAAATVAATMFAMTGIASAAILVDDSSTLTHSTALATLLGIFDRNFNTLNTTQTGVGTSGGNVASAADDQEDITITAGDSDVALGEDVTANEIDIEATIDTSGGPSHVGSATNVTVSDESSATISHSDTISESIDKANDNDATTDQTTVASSGGNVAASGDGQSGVNISSGVARTTGLKAGMFNILRQVLIMRR